MRETLASLAPSTDLEFVARRCVWFMEPKAALARPAHFIGHVLTYGTAEDVKTLRRYVPDDMLAAALDHAPRAGSMAGPGRTGN